MKFGFPISILLHSSFAFGGMLLFSKTIDPTNEGRVIPVDIITVAETTNIRATVKANKPEDIDPDVAPMTLEDPQENAPEEDAAQVGAEPQPAEDTPSKSAELITPSDTAKDRPKPEKDKPNETPSFSLDNLSALVDKSRKAQPEKNQQKTLQSELNTYEFAKMAQAGSGLGTSMTLSEIDALQSRMYKCWRVSVDAKNPEDLVVRVRVQLHPDGQVKHVELMDKARINASGDPYLKIAAERAVRAVTKCAPYDFLPSDKYGRWKDMELSFRPEV